MVLCGVPRSGRGQMSSIWSLGGGCRSGKKSRNARRVLAIRQRHEVLCSALATKVVATWELNPRHKAFFNACASCPHLADFCLLHGVQAMLTHTESTRAPCGALVVIGA